MIEGRPECVSELMTRYGGALRALLRRSTNGAADWEDLCQETWLRVVRYAHRYDPTFAFATWLFRIAWNIAQDHARVQHRRGHHYAPTLEGPNEPIDGSLLPEDQYLTNERSTNVLSCVHRLPPNLAEAILLRYFEDLSEKDMAERLGVPKGTVKSRLHSAHRRLADLIGGM